MDTDGIAASLRFRGFVNRPLHNGCAKRENHGQQKLQYIEHGIHNEEERGKEGGRRLLTCLAGN